MATNNFLVFDANASNIMSQSDYTSSNDRLNGVKTGIADSTLHNRIFRQSSIMVAALGQVIADAGTNANDTSLQDLVDAIKATLVVKSGSTVDVGSGGTGASTFTNNALLTGNGSSAIKTVATAKGAAYASGANSTITFGTLDVAYGGTGLTTATNKNAVVIGNSSTVTNALQTVRTASGAFYATGQDSKPIFGTLPIAQGGTGATTASNIRSAIGLGQSTGVLGTAYGGTGNNSVDSTPTTNSTKMVTSGGIKTALDLKANLASPTFTGTPKAPTASAATNTTQIATTEHVKSVLNRNNAVNTANESYTTVMARGIQASTTDLTAGTTALTSGTIYLVYEV